MSGIIVDPPYFMDQEATRHLLMEARLSFQGEGSTKLYVLPSSGQIPRCVAVITIYHRSEHRSERSPDYVEIDEVDVPKKRLGFPWRISCQKACFPPSSARSSRKQTCSLMMLLAKRLRRILAAGDSLCLLLSPL